MSQLAGTSSPDHYERLGGNGRLGLVDVIAQSVGFLGPVFSVAVVVPLLVGVVSASGYGAGGAAPLAVAIAAVGVLGLGWIVAQFTKRIQAAGSLYDYIADGLGDRVGAVAGWVYYSGVLALGAGIAVLEGGDLHDLIASEFGSSPLPVWAWNVLLLVLVAAILHTGVRVSTRAQLGLALCSLVVMTAFFVFLVARVGSGNSLKAFDPASSPTHWSGVLFGVLFGVLLFTGFESAANLAEESERPARNVPRAVIAAVLVAAVFYLLGTYAQVAGFHFDLTRIAGAAAGPAFILAGPHAGGGYGGVGLRRLIELVVLLDMTAVYIGVSVAGARGVFAMARDRRLPRQLARIAPTRGTPLGGNLLVVAVYLVWVLLTQFWTGLFAVPNTPHYAAMFSFLSTFGPFCLALIYLLLSVAAVPGLRGHAAPWKIGLAAVVGVLVTAGAIFGAVYKVPKPTIYAPYAVIGWAIVGVLATVLWRGRARASALGAPANAATLPAPAD